MGLGRHRESTPELLTTLCAILRGEAEAPLGEEGQRLFDLARGHRVDHLVACRGGAGPASLDRPRLETLLLEDVCVRELTRVLAALEEVGAQPLVFKGAALAHTHYPESWLRPRLDSDVLIAEDRRPQVFDVLGSLGYQRPAFVSGDLVMYQTMFVREDPAVIEHVLDLHWRVANCQTIACTLTHAELVARGSTVSALGYPMRVPSAVDALVLACLHRAAHHGDAEDLLWLYDIHLVAGRLSPSEWGHVTSLASDRGVRAICARGLQLAQERFETVVPAGVVEQLTPDTRSPREPSAVYLRKDLRPVDRLWVDLRALGPWAGAHLVWEHVCPPADYMARTYGVRHRMLLPVYYARRAFRGASKWLGRSRRRD